MTVMGWCGCARSDNRSIVCFCAAKCLGERVRKESSESWRLSQRIEKGLCRHREE